MSNRRRPTSANTRRFQPTPPPGIPITKVKTPADVVTIVPYLLGFDPIDSIVIIALEGPRQRFGPCARLDLVDCADAPERTAAYLAAVTEQHGFDPVLLIAYSDEASVADPVMAAVLHRLFDEGVTVHDAVRADGHRWWSYVCSDPLCCPATGVPYDAQASEVAAEAVLAGLSRAPDREALRVQFTPDPARRDAFCAVVAGAPARHLDVPALCGVVDDALADPATLGPVDEVALVVAVQEVTKRDAVWATMTQANAPDHFDLWRHLLRAAPDELMAPVGGLTAFAAWLSGRGVLASHAAERVLDVHPDYSMAVLLLDACEASINPAIWDRVRGETA